ncbi:MULTISPECIES: FAD-binding oxidoreductase [unclassified Pseudomonas]|uniref:FAD-binding oxidoreductase n=1 Tax=unclassified Pseudomonas TaxID=196821 RepID=UPI0008714735|nr:MULTISPECIES: FAD-binding oxidoreductase [unclassified Pseudomonas]SCW87479.1 FAD/FMN-containing dehydrogenase [Pseudomonas sp. NFACC05-1]SCZ38780.1 FAD/FMN-containing dehydrogenase [Pseudomonas sp. NFACC44-2]SDA77670.1 FAD/FMN-containing dehydrogenase [Pseudomonas sp. NFACC51]SDW06975.1 FAD/FMN-containing dehydrogenase [Pseudomonas sp. NFACC08-1]SEJ78287.1 FAD/FMN-containing dehydrogenase [Pseudomonas sp. NFACC07-1]
MPSLSDEVLQRIEQVVGQAGLVRDPALMQSYLTDWRNAYQGQAALVVRPATTEEVAEVVRICHDAQVALVPQGGNTGLNGGSIPDASGSQLVLSLNRMKRIREIDLANETITVEAGVILQHLQDAASQVGRLFPLSLGAEGSCTVGGNLATNAGGTAVLRYGNMRELTLGLEVVLPDGRVWNGLRGLRKDNTGYDLKHLFIGSEGTLGIITAAVLKLFPATHSTATAWVALPSPQAAVELIGHVRSLCADRLTGFEMMSRQSLDFVLDHVAGCSDPLETKHPWYALIELRDTVPDAPLTLLLENGLAHAFERGWVSDAVLASNQTQAAALWALREGISEAQNHEGPSLKHDISVPVSRIPEFIERTDSVLQQDFAGVRIVSYGHMGDGNLHYNISKPLGETDASFRAREHAIMEVIYRMTSAFNGSISAEHGLGQAKPDAAVRFKDPLEIELMRAIKRTLDPAGLMNPGKVFTAGLE